MTADTPEHPSLSIGAVSNATDIPAATLRTWERRYGFPAPERTEAGHRRYCCEVLERLRLIRRAVDGDFRPSDVVPLPVDQLRELLEPSGPSSREMDVGGQETPAWLEQWRQMVIDLDGSELDSAMETAWNQMGGLRFLERRLVPMLEQIGREWSAGVLGIAHEHYVSERVEDFLAARWRPFSNRNRGPVAMCATLPGEDHLIGLHIAAVLLALHGWQVVFLGARTPTEELARAATDEQVDAVAVSFSECYVPENADRSLAALRAALPDDIALLTGGGGAPDLPEVTTFSDLPSFAEWARKEAERRG